MPITCLNTADRCCAAVPSRFRATLVPLIERWFTNIAPLVRRALKKTPRAPPVRIGSLARRAVDQLLYTALYEIIGYDGNEEIKAPYEETVLVMPSKRLFVGKTAVRLAYPIY